MALPQPFNTVEDLVLWSGFEQGPSQGQASVLSGTFALSQFETALQESRREIYRRAGRKANDEYDEDRADELKECERYLACSRLYPNFGARMQLEFPESNLASVGDVMTGADTPDPYSKGRQLVEFMYSYLRRIGLGLLRGNRNFIRPFTVGSDNPPFPFEAEYVGIEESHASAIEETI